MGFKWGQLMKSWIAQNKCFLVRNLSSNLTLIKARQVIKLITISYIFHDILLGFFFLLMINVAGVVFLFVMIFYYVFYKGILIVRLPLDLTFTPIQLKFKILPIELLCNKGAISYGFKISRAVRYHTSLGYHIVQYMWYHIYFKTLYEQFCGNLLNFNSRQRNVRS